MAKLAKSRMCGWAVRTALALVALFAIRPATALTVRTKSDLRHWKTVFDRTEPLFWTWEPAATAAHLTFSNKLTQAVASVDVVRTAGARQGCSPHPLDLLDAEGLVVATLAQTSNNVQIACETTELAYVPGTGRSIVVRTPGRDWQRVERPRLSAFDAQWWNVAGSSDYEVLWAEPPGRYRVERAFGGVGVEAELKFGVLGCVMSLR